MSHGSSPTIPSTKKTKSIIGALEEFGVTLALAVRMYMQRYLGAASTLTGKAHRWPPKRAVIVGGSQKVVVSSKNALNALTGANCGW